MPQEYCVPARIVQSCSLFPIVTLSARQRIIACKRFQAVQDLQFTWASEPMMTTYPILEPLLSFAMAFAAGYIFAIGEFRAVAMIIWGADLVGIFLWMVLRLPPEPPIFILDYL